MLDPHFDFGHELLVGGMKTKDCKWADSEFANAYVFRKRSDPYSVAKTCWLGEWAGQKLEWDDVILRWFHSDYCNFYKSGIFNTVMIVKLSRRPSPETLLCTGTAMISGSEPDAVSTLEPGAVIYRGADVELVYTPLCGIDEHERPNAKRILRSAGGTRDDDNPWK
jgi:hypothetical protein